MKEKNPKKKTKRETLMKKVIKRTYDNLSKMNRKIILDEQKNN